MPLPSEDTTPPVTKTRGVAERGEFMASAGRWKATVYRDATSRATLEGQVIDSTETKTPRRDRGVGAADAQRVDSDVLFFLKFALGVFAITGLVALGFAGFGLARGFVGFSLAALLGFGFLGIL